MSAAEKMICWGNMPSPNWGGGPYRSWRFGKHFRVKPTSYYSDHQQILSDTHVCIISKHDLSALHGLNMANRRHCWEISQQNGHSFSSEVGLK